MEPSTLSWGLDLTFLDDTELDVDSISPTPPSAPAASLLQAEFSFLTFVVLPLWLCGPLGHIYVQGASQCPIFVSNYVAAVGFEPPIS